MTVTKRERIEARVTPEQKALLIRAAELSGRSLSEFIIASAEQTAETLIRDHHIISLSVADSQLFADALLNPTAPNAKLRAAIARYSKEVVES